MAARPSRVRLLLVLLAGVLGLSALAACSTDTGDAGRTGAPTGGTTARGPEPGAYPVTIADAFGRTTISHEPRRIVTLGSADQDILLALGVVPVGVPKVGWGGNADGSTPWFDAALKKLGGTAPTRYDDSDGTPISDIAKLSPDLILATQSGVTKAEYEKLMKIAPVIVYPGTAWLTPWQQSVSTVAKALGRPAAGAALIAATDADFTRVARANPSIVGRTFVMTYLSTTDMSKIDYYTPSDVRVKVLTQLGLKVAPVISRISAKNQFYGTISAERSSELSSDLLITYADSPNDIATFRKNALLGEIPALKSGHYVAAVNRTDALGLSSPTPLSLPYALDRVVPQIVQALAGNA